MIDGTGETLLPGFIDAHAHAFGDGLREALIFGVTTELDMFTDQKLAAEIKQDQREGRDVELADLRSAGTLATAPGGHGTEYGLRIPTLTSPDEAQAFVDARIQEGSDYIKIVYDDGKLYGRNIPTLDKPTMRALVAAAHKRGKLALVHVMTLAAARDALEAGADGLAHIFLDVPPDGGFAALAAAHHAFVVPTLSVVASMSGVPAGSTLAADARLRPYLSATNLSGLEGSFGMNCGSLDNAREAVRALHAKHVPILAGTDAPNPGTTHGASLHGELELLLQSGLTPQEALAAATAVPARVFGLTDRGRIAKGLRADLVLVRGNPAADITTTRDIVSVWKAGIRVDRAAYLAEREAERQAAAAEKDAPPPAGAESGWISDFDDGKPGARFGYGWMVSTDSIMGGKSTARMRAMPGGADGTPYALQIDGELVAGNIAWSGAMFCPGEYPISPVNLSARRTLTFWTKGDGLPYSVMVYSKSAGYIPKMRSFTAGPEWTKISMDLAGFKTDGHDLMGMLFGVYGTPGKFQFSIDGVRLE